jgi:hypothetical protein
MQPKEFCQPSFNMSRYLQMVCWKSIGYILHKHPASSADDSKVILAEQLREIPWVV